MHTATMQIKAVSSLFIVTLLSASCISAFQLSSITGPLRKLLQTNNFGTLLGGTVAGPFVLNVNNAPPPIVQNPYGMVVIPQAYGQWHANDLLISGWNDDNNPPNPGQGKSIATIRGGTVVDVTTFDITAPQHKIPWSECKSFGVGFTMAMTYLTNGYILQCTVPIPISGSNKGVAQPGCCFIIDSTWTVVATFRNNDINGPWGATSYKSGGDVYIWLSNVLGSTGNVVRYKISNFPSKNSDWQSGDGSSQYGWGAFGKGVIVATGFSTTPAQIGNGVVGPSGLVYTGGSNQLLYIAATQDDGGKGIIYYIQNALTGGQNQNRHVLHACNTGTTGDCNMPVGLNLVSGYLVTPSAGSNAVSAFDTSGKLQSWVLLPGVTAGQLFNAIGYNGYTVYVDDVNNAFGTIAQK